MYDDLIDYTEQVILVSSGGDAEPLSLALAVSKIMAANPAKRLRYAIAAVGRPAVFCDEAKAIYNRDDFPK